MNGKHALIMALCCLIPLAAIFLVSVFNVSLSNLGVVAMVVLCPLMHLLMMRGMGGHRSQPGQASCHEPGSEPAPRLTSGKG